MSANINWERIEEEQARRAVNRYNSAKGHAELNWGCYLETRHPFDVEVANDWVDAANRAVDTAAKFGITLEAMPLYQETN